MKECPEVPKSESKREIGFVRQPMVSWFNPGQLVVTGMKAVLSAIFGVYADKREIQAALPCALSEEPPHLYAIPGNHDWYDGLTSFTRLFLQERWIGGWKTQQSRSYFALKLPHNWWLFATIANFPSILAHSPGTIVFLLIIAGGLIGFCKPDKWAEPEKSKKQKRTIVRVAAGAVHGFAHVFLIVLLAWFFSSMNARLFGLEAGTAIHSLIFALEVFIFGGILGGLLFGIYLCLGSLCLKVNLNENFSCQAIADYKNFLRLHLDGNGKLTVHPVGIEKVCKKWRLNKPGKKVEPWFLPKEGHEIKTHLIEKPIVIGPDK